MRPFGKLFGLLALLVACGSAAMPTGSAQDGAAAPAVMAARANAAVPAGVTVALRFRDDTDLNNRLIAVFAESLQAKGFAVGDRGELVLTYETLVEERGAGDGAARLGGGGGSDSGAEVTLQLAVPLQKPKLGPRGRRYSMNLQLGRPKQPPLWIGSATAVTAEGDRFSVHSLLARALCDVVGETVSARPIPIE